MKKISLNHLVLGASLLTALAACTKPRPADINDDETKSQIFALSELQGQQFNIQTGDALQSMSELQNDPHALSEKPQVAIKSSTAPSRLQNVFQALPISAESSKSYAVRLSVDSKMITMLRLVNNANELNDLEKGSMIQQQKINLVPVAQIAVKDYGTLCRVKNDYGESTSNLKICHTDFAQATHVQISLKSDDMQAALGQHSMDQVFLANRLNGKVTTLSALQQQLKFSLYPVSDDKVVTYTKSAAGSEVDLLIYKIAKKSQITDDKILQQLNSNLRLGKVVQCPKEVLATLTADEQKDCVLILADTVKGDAMRADTQTTDDFGRPGIKVALEKTDSKSSNLVQFEAAVPAIAVNPTDLTQLNPYNTLRIADILNKEFMMRRTFEDAASTLTGFGPGASGYMDLVRFELQDKALVVRRVIVINGARDATNIDKEEVMSIPVTYKKIDPVTVTSISPSLIDATKSDAQYAFLDWTGNTIAATNSPLSYVSGGPESCFKSTSRQDITDLDNRLQNGILSFSINGSYTFSPGCITFNSLHDYWEGNSMQSNFNIKERISFMVNKGTQDNNPGMSVAFSAQNLLGYGIFTTDQLKPDQYGNRNGIIGTENPLPVIYDFSNGKQLVYNLGGLPDDKGSWVYQALVDGTKEVVADWNKALHRAFVGTSLDRAGDFIVLKVDGVDTTVGHLGDLDRSYIWNFTKNMDSGLLGLSQAAPNPRSGRIEQNNVLMYSGNLIGELGIVRNLVRKQMAYRQMRESARQSLEKQALINSAENANLPTDGANGGLNVEGKNSQAMKNMRLANSSQMTMNALSARNELKAIMPGNFSLLAKKNKYFPRAGDDMLLERIIQKAITQKATRDSDSMEAIAAVEMLKSNDLSFEQRQNLMSEARRLSLKSKFNKNFNQHAGCILSAQELESAFSADPELLDESKTAEVFKKWYKATLTHEMGHSLGLTHNFEGSVDKDNFLFAGEKASPTSRNYSSIMDYVSDEYQNYAGPGPYDVRALRVAYTGMIEISPLLKSFVKDDGKGGKVLQSPDGKVSIPLSKASDDFYYELPMATYQKLALGNQSWWRLDSSMVQRLPVKSYMYCTDKDIGEDPLCNRWDLGTNEKEIVDFYIQQYKDQYATSNTRGDDLMSIPSSSKYVSRHLLTNFFGIRPFLEEGFYRAMYGNYSNEQIRSAFLAGLEGYQFFVELAGSPTEDLDFSSTDRFHLFKHDYTETGKDGKATSRSENILVETKSMQSRLVPGSDFDIQTRGVEQDKAVALFMLTKPGTGRDRYDAHSLALSYADFEHYVLKLDANNSLIFSLIQGTLSNSTPSFIFTPHGPTVLPEDEYQVDISDLFRYRALMSAGVSLETSSLTDKGNYAALFRVSSSQNGLPKDRLAVAQLDQSLASPASVKYWALDNADIAGQLVATAAGNRRAIENADKIGADLLKLYASSKALKQATGDVALAAAKADLQAQATATLTDLSGLNSDGALASSPDPEQAKKALAQSMSEAVSYMSMLEEIATPLLKNSDDQMNAPAVQNELSEIKKDGARMAQKNALIGIAGKAMVSDKSNAALAKMISAMVDTQVLENQHGIIVKNLDILNQLLIEQHPEMNRY